MLNAYKKSYKQVIDAYPKVTIPSYQREYIWGENEWEDFYNDIINIIRLDFKPHFMGTLLLKENDTSCEIIDGQQRLVTLNLFLMAYRDAYQDILTVSYILDLIANRIVVRDSNNIYDAIYNNTYVQGERTLTCKESKNLEKAYLYFLKRLSKKGLFGKVTTDFNVYRILKKLFFITIEIDSDASPYLIFETLNTRGVDLDISDLVKNHLIDKSQGDQEFSSFISREWDELTTGLSSASFEKVFQSYYQSLNNRKMLLKEITTEVNEVHEIRVFLRNLGSYVKLYKKLEDDTVTVWDGNQDYIRFVKYLKSYENNHTLKILAIPIMTSFPKKRRIGALKILESLIFRYVIICQKDEDSLLVKLQTIAKRINEKSINSIQLLKDDLKEFLVDDNEFIYSFAYRSIEYSHDYSNPMLRYILYKIENYLVQEERYTLGISDASVEHIHSQSHAPVNEIFRLGNYALLTREQNSNADDKDFVMKNEEYYKHSTFEITNGSAASTIKSLQTYNSWNLENINKRQLQMAQIAVKVWKI